MGRFFDFSPMRRGQGWWWWMQRDVKDCFRELLWAFRHRFGRRHCYDRIYIDTLAPGYHDKEQQILHACFQILVNYAERERHPSWWRSAVPGHAVPKSLFLASAEEEFAEREILDLYNWWKNVYPNREKTAPKLEGAEGKNWGELGKLPGYHEYCQKYSEWEDQCTEEDTRNLIRLMMVRSHLWS